MPRPQRLGRRSPGHSGACFLRVWGALGVIALFCYCIPFVGADDEDGPIFDKVGVEVHLTKKERQTLEKVECSMCKFIVKEMHVEVSNHKMVQGGWGSEEKVWETSNAICLGMLQKYNLLLDKHKIEPKTEEEEANGPAMDGDPAVAMRGILVFKMGCQRWVDDYGGDTVGYIYKNVRDSADRSAVAVASDICLGQFNQCGKNKKEKRREEKDKAKNRDGQRRTIAAKEEKELAKQIKDDPMSQLPEDSKLGLQRMLEMAVDDPLHYIEDDARKRILKAQKELHCDVCRVVLEDAHVQTMQKASSLRSEHDILGILDGACAGGKDKSIPAYFGVEPPPLPPVWTDRWRPTLDKTSKLYRLKAFPSKAAKRRRAWRELTLTGRHTPPGAQEGEGDMKLTFACKAMLASERMSEEHLSPDAELQGQRRSLRRGPGECQGHLQGEGRRGLQLRTGGRADEGEARALSSSRMA